MPRHTERAERDMWGQMNQVVHILLYKGPVKLDCSKGSDLYCMCNLARPRTIDLNWTLVSTIEQNI